MIAIFCIIIAFVIIGIGIYSEIVEQRRLRRMAQDCKAKEQQS